MMKIGIKINAKFQKDLGIIYIECYVIIINDDVYDIIFFYDFIVKSVINPCIISISLYRLSLYTVVFKAVKINQFTFLTKELIPRSFLNVINMSGMSRSNYF